jgi:hypothetical protein
MMTPADKVEWALRFVRKEIPSPEGEEWRQLTVEVQDFCRGVPGDGLTLKADDFTRKDFMEMKKEAKSLFSTFGLSNFINVKSFSTDSPLPFIQQLQQLRGQKPPPAEVRTTTIWTLPVHSVSAFTVYISQEQRAFMITATPVEAFLYTLANALLTVDLDDFLLCEQCGAPFVRFRKGQKFCSTKCNRKVALQMFRARQRQEKAKSKQAEKSAR